MHMGNIAHQHPALPKQQGKWAAVVVGALEWTIGSNGVNVQMIDELE